MKKNNKILKYLAGAVFCIILWSINGIIAQFFPDYPSEFLLYGCVFILFVLAIRTYNKNLVHRTEPPGEKEEREPKNTASHAALTIEESLKFRQMLNEHFTKNHSFCKPGYTIRDLSNETGVPVYLLSSTINKEYGINFNELVNAHRVDYLAKMFKTSADCNAYTLEAIGKMAGFNSRAAFIAAIKKHTGMNPSLFFGRKPCEQSKQQIFINPVKMYEVA